MTRFLLFLSLVLLLNAAELDDALAQIEEDELGREILQQIQLQVKSGDPVDRIVQIAEGMRDKSQQNVNDYYQERTNFQKDCRKELDGLIKGINDYKINQKSSNINLGQQQETQETAHKRLEIKYAQLELMRQDLESIKNQRVEQLDSYEYNMDKIQKADLAFETTKGLFVRYLLNNDKFQNGKSFFQKQSKYNKFDDDDDDEEYFQLEDEDDGGLYKSDERSKTFAFVKIAAGVKKARESLVQMQGFQGVLEGFEEITALLHSGVINSDAEISSVSDLIEISHLIVEICEDFIDWINDLREYEENSNSMKQKQYGEVQKLMEKQIRESEQDFQQAQEHVKVLDQEVDRIKTKMEDTKFILQSQEENYKFKEDACNDGQYNYDEGLKQRKHALTISEQLVDLIVRKGGQFQEVIASKIYK